jgi:LemA protein
MSATLTATSRLAERPVIRTICFIAAVFALLVSVVYKTRIAAPDDAEVKASLTEVLDLYSQRLRLVSEVTSIAQGKFKRGSPALSAITSARAELAAVAATPALANDAVAFERFDIAQRQMTDAVSALMVEAESVPGLNSNPRFRALQGNLALWGTQIGTARIRYDEAAQTYNATLHRFPHNIAALLCAAHDKPLFNVPDRPPLRTLPHIDFRELRGPLQV